MLETKGRLRVLMTPDATANNAYQKLLAGTLEKMGSQVCLSAPRSFLLNLFRIRPHIVHVHWIEPAFLGRTLLSSMLRLATVVPLFALIRLSGIRIIWTLHNRENHEDRVPTLNALANKAFGTIANKVIVLSEYSLKEAVTTHVTSFGKLKVIPHGNYIDAYRNEIGREDARRRLGLSETSVVFLFCGAIRRYKGVIELIRAFKDLDSPNAVLLIAGKPMTKELAIAVAKEAGDDGRIILKLGFVPDNDLQVYFNASDVTVLPYRKTLNSGSVWLAMSFGSCCVAPAFGSIPETINNSTGVLFDPKDPKGLSTALELALQRRSEMLARGKAALATARAVNWMDLGKATLETYYDQR